jgi:hypothetical protein
LSNQFPFIWLYKLYIQIQSIHPTDCIAGEVRNEIPDDEEIILVCLTKQEQEPEQETGKKKKKMISPIRSMHMHLDSGSGASSTSPVMAGLMAGCCCCCTKASCPLVSPL